MNAEEIQDWWSTKIEPALTQEAHDDGVLPSQLAWLLMGSAARLIGICSYAKDRPDVVRVCVEFFNDQISKSAEVTDALDERERFKGELN